MSRELLLRAFRNFNEQKRTKIVEKLKETSNLSVADINELVKEEDDEFEAIIMKLIELDFGHYEEDHTGR